LTSPSSPPLRVAGKTPFAGFEELFRPGGILGEAFPPALMIPSEIALYSKISPPAIPI
jgi:hypothetical protein